MAPESRTTKDQLTTIQENVIAGLAHRGSSRRRRDTGIFDACLKDDISAVPGEAEEIAWMARVGAPECDVSSP
jgi:hypothetical protein